MSLTLLLVRHAQSADKQSGQTDHDRELTLTGRRHATALGLFFEQRKYFFDGIVCSTAIRAKQTVEQIMEAAENSQTNRIFFDEDLYHGTYQDYYHKLMNLSDRLRTVLMVSHNPSISELLSFLTPASSHTFSPGGFAELQFEWNSWSELREHSGKLITFRNPMD